MIETNHYHIRALRLLRTIIGSESQVLEMGTSEFSFQQLEKIPCRAWKSLDLVPPADYVVDLDQADLCLPVEQSLFDVIICSFVLEHLRYGTALLSEIYRVLPLGGRLLISVPNICSLTYRAAWLMGHIPACAASGDLGPELNGTGYFSESTGRWWGGHVCDYNETRLKAVLNKAGFVNIKTYGSGLYRKGQILPYWALPPALASDVIAVAHKES